VQAFEVRHFGLVSGLNEGLVTGGDQGAHAAAQRRSARQTNRFRFPRGTWFENPGARCANTYRASQYLEGKGVPSLIAVYQNPSKQARKVAPGPGQRYWRNARRGSRNHVPRGNRKPILFGEQTVLCGGVSALVTAVTETLIEAGYQPEMAYFECLHELKLIVDLMNEAGISGMRFSISETAKWATVSIGPKIIDPGVRQYARKRHGSGPSGCDQIRVGPRFWNPSPENTIATCVQHALSRVV